MVPALSPNRPEPKENCHDSPCRADPGLVRPRPSNTAPLRRGSLFANATAGGDDNAEQGDAEHKMRDFINRFLMHYGIYRRYPLGRFPALRNAWRAAQP
jgi:hypothetical protein